MRFTRTPIVCGLAWSSGVVSLLLLGSRPGDLAHSLFGDALCGPWGCMPPLQALFALHGLWALAFLAFGACVMGRWPPLRLEVVGCVLSAAGLVTLGILIGRELLTWYPSVPPTQQKYIGQRILYVLGTSTDLPVVQTFLAGVAFYCKGRDARKARYSLVEDGGWSDEA